MIKFNKRVFSLNIYRRLDELTENVMANYSMICKTPQVHDFTNKKATSYEKSDYLII